MEKIEQAIEILAGKIVQSIKSDDAMRFTQAALNMAHVNALLAAEARGPIEKTKGAGQSASRA